MLRKKAGKFLEKLIILDTRYKMRKVFKSNCRDNFRVLDLGCGARGSLDYDRVGLDIFLNGYDLDESSVKSFSKKYGKIIESFGIINALELEKIGKFDLIVSGGVIQYVKTPSAMISKIRSMLKKEGILILSTVNVNSFFRRLRVLSKKPKTKDGEHKIYSIEEIEKILRAGGFEVLEVIGADFFPFPKDLCSNILFLCRPKS